MARMVRVRVRDLSIRASTHCVMCAARLRRCVARLPTAAPYHRGPMAYHLGTLRGLDACSSERGTFTVLALDHRQNLRKELRPDDPSSVTEDEMVDFKRAVVRELRRSRDRRAARPRDRASGRRSRTARSPAGPGSIVAVEATGYEGPPGARVSRVLPGLGRRRRSSVSGASAAKLLVYYHPDAPNARATRSGSSPTSRPHAARPTSPCSSSRSRSALDGGKLHGRGAPARRRRDGVAARPRSARDILKAEFPYDAAVTDERRWAEACAELDAATPVPWVLLSGGVDDATFERQVAVACRAGASGVLVGRSVWAEAATLPGPARDAFLAGTGARSARPAHRARRRPRGPVAASLDRRARAGAARSRLVRAVLSPRTTVRDLDLLVVGELNADIVVTDPDPVPAFGQAERLVRGRPADARQLVRDHRLRGGPARPAGGDGRASSATTRSAGSCSTR